MTRGLWRQIADAAARNGAKTMLLYIPEPADLKFGKRSAIPEMEKTGLPFFSLFDTLSVAARSHGVEGLSYPVDEHYNSRTNALIAKAAGSFIIDEFLRPYKKDPT